MAMLLGIYVRRTHRFPIWYGPPLLRPVVIYWEIVNCDNLVDIYVYHQLLEPIVTGEIIWV